MTATEGEPAPIRITVIGCGYLGVTHAACMAELGYDVLGVETDLDRVAALQAGVLPFFEPGLESLLRHHLDRGRLRFTSSAQEAGEWGDVHFLCVGTPQDAEGIRADLSHLEGAVVALAEHLHRRSLVVGKSTVPVGTAQRLAAELVQRAPAGQAVELAWSPEFLREGHAIEDTLHPDRLVFGVASAWSEAMLRRTFEPLIEAEIPVIVTDYATAELVKASANAFLATKISFINAMAEVCEASGADVVELARALGHDPRIGSRFLRAGIGFGGGCLAKDLRAFVHRAGELGVPAAVGFLREVDNINLRRRQRVVDMARALVNDIASARVCVLGAAFKPDSDDIRDSPALWVAGQLQLAGASVCVYDPQAMEGARKMFPTLDYADSAQKACEDSDIVLHLTEWAEFREIDPAVLAGTVAQRNIIDGRNCLDAAGWKSAGWNFRALGSR